MPPLLASSSSASSSASSSKVRAIADEEARLRARAAELESLIASSSTSVVKRSRAQVELQGLRRRPGMGEPKNLRSSVRALMRADSRDGNGGGGKRTTVVSRGRALVERDIERERLRAEREGRIEAMQREHGEEQCAVRRRALEERLRAAREEVERMADEEEESRKDDDDDAIERAARRFSPADGELDSDGENEEAESGFVGSQLLGVSGDDFDEDDDEEDNTNDDVFDSFDTDANLSLSFTQGRPQLMRKMTPVEEDHDDDESKSPNPASQRSMATCSFTSVGSEGKAALSVPDLDHDHESPTTVMALNEVVNAQTVRDGGFDSMPGLTRSSESPEVSDEASRIALLEEQLKLWKEKAVELSMKCDELEEDKAELEDDKALQDMEIKGLRAKLERLQLERKGGSSREGSGAAGPALHSRPSIGGGPQGPPLRSRPSLNGLGRRASRRYSSKSLLVGSFSAGAGADATGQDAAERYESQLAKIRDQGAAGQVAMEKQLREEARLEVQALEEALKAIDDEKGDLMKELEAMRAVLENTSDGDEDHHKKKKAERLVYQLSCKKCNKHGNFVGTTSTSLKETMERHICRVVEETKSKKSNRDPGGKGGGGGKTSATARKHLEGCAADEEIAGGNSHRAEKWSAEFAQHFARHCRPKLGGLKTMTDREVKKFCQHNVKVEVLRRHDGAELMWEVEED